ncbi:hypothetical protein [Litorimonas sp.]|uniref:hypothetical protein n=1 Tax=Litorimonas sp. TaxID=1892381 RepID=UPI003A83CB2E
MTQETESVEEMTASVLRLLEFNLKSTPVTLEKTTNLITRLSKDLAESEREKATMNGWLDAILEDPTVFLGIKRAIRESRQALKGGEG